MASLISVSCISSLLWIMICFSVVRMVLVRQQRNLPKLPSRQRQKPVHRYISRSLCLWYVIKSFIWPCCCVSGSQELTKHFQCCFQHPVCLCSLGLSFNLAISCTVQISRAVELGLMPVCFLAGWCTNLGFKLYSCS